MIEGLCKSKKYENRAEKKRDIKIVPEFQKFFVGENPIIGNINYQ